MTEVPATPRKPRQLTAEISAEKTPQKPQPAKESALVKRSAQDSNALSPKGCTLSWFRANLERISKADSQISVALADRKQFSAHTSPEMHKICDEIFNNVLKIGPHGSENNSVLLLGEAQSGKTHVVEWCIKELQKTRPSTVVLRAKGGAYATDVECLRHLATQMSSRLESVPHANASFKAGMDWIKGVFKGSFKQASNMVMVLDQFEHFCSRARQTLLYNLFDIAQEAGVHLSVIGTSEKMDVMESLEKRIRSRFSMRHLHTFLPTTMDGLVQVLQAQLGLTADCGLNAAFVSQFNKYVEAALFAKRNEWKPHLELGRAPSWFLARCLPVACLLHDACECEEAPVPKRARLAHLPSSTNHESTMLFLESLTEDDHIVLIALYRLNARGLTRTLSTVLHEIELFHNQPGNSLLHTFSADLYASAFDRLLRLKLVELAKSTTSDIAKRHLPCASCVDRIYGDFVRDLGNSVPGPIRNPLRGLPASIQQWASRQRASE